MVAALQPRIGTGNLNLSVPQRPQIDRPPQPPRNAALRVFANGTWQVSWNDIRIPQGADETIQPPTWIVGFCRDSAAGPQSSSLDWARNVRDKSTQLYSQESVGRGGVMTYFQGDVSIGDGWVVVWGETITGKRGEPCLPMHDIVSTTTGAIPAFVVLGTCARSTRKVALKDNTNKVYYFQHTFNWKPPAESLVEFGGMQTYMAGLNGSAAILEAATECQWDGTTGTQAYTFRTPEDAGLGDTVATFTHGSAAVVWVSGTTFSATNNGRTMVVYGANADDTVKVFDTTQLSRTDSHHMTMNTTFTGTTGNYTMRLYNAITYYLIGVSVVGVRQADPTTTTATFVI